MIGQRKSFYRQRIPECSCVRKDTLDIDFLVTSGNGDRKTMQSIRITNRPPLRIRKWNQLSQFRWTSTKVIAIERLKGATFWRWAKGSREVASERHAKSYLTIPSSSEEYQSRYDSSILMHGCMVDL